MKVRRKVSLLVAGALFAATVALMGATPAVAAGKLVQTGPCGDQLVMRVKNVGDPINVGIAIPSTDPTEVWKITVIQQDYGSVSGGRIGAPIDQTAAFPPLTFSAATNDDPPNQAVLDLTFSGLALVSGDTVTVQYSRPLIGNQASLQDLEGLKTANFGGSRSPPSNRIRFFLASRAA
jgi:hypothetical protein